MLINAHSRDDCVSLDYWKKEEYYQFLDDTRFWKFGEFQYFVPQHNGACVYECYAEATGLRWDTICNYLLDCTYDEVVKRKCHRCFVSCAVTLDILQCWDIPQGQI